MSEALNKFILGKAKTRATFDKKFSGQDGALSLMEMIGDAPKGVQKQAQKIFQANADDVDKAVQEIGNLAYGSAAPPKKTGVQGRTNAPAERIEGDNLPNSASDKGTLAPIPEEKGKGKRGRNAAAQQTPKKEEAAAAPPPKQEAAAPEGDEAELDSAIGQFVPMQGVGGVEVAGSFMPSFVDPRVSMMVGANPTPTANPSDAFDMSRFLSDPSFQGIGADGTMQASAPAPNAPAPIEPKPAAPPASQPGLSSQDMDFLSSMGLDYLAPAPALSQMDLSDLIGGGTAKPRTSPTMYGPFSDGLFDMNSGTALEPPANPALPGTISPDGGFLGMDQSPSMFNREGGFMDGDYGPSPFNNAGGVMDGEYGPPGSMTPPTKRPPFYDPNRTMGQWWNEPGLVSRANEFLYQRGMPAGIARAIQPTASVLDKTMKVAGPLGVGLGAGYGALTGAGAIANMGGESTSAVPPTDEEQAALQAEADESMRQLEQILGGNTLRKPASAPPAAPVK